jgi:hypothetical protein
VKIDRLEIENVKRVKALSLEPTANGLTIVGGRNNQGKTSVLDAIAWALGGDRFKPSQPVREGSATPPHLHVELSNGLVVERKGPNSSLKVIDPRGNKAGQQLLNDFVESLALDLPKFLNASAKDKASILLKIIGVGERLYELEAEEQRLYNKRHEIGQIADQKKKAADEMPWHPEAPTEPVSASDLIKQQQDILGRNGENQRKRQQVDTLELKCAGYRDAIDEQEKKLERMRAELAEAAADLDIARKSAEELADESTAEIEASIAQIDQTNAKVRDNQAKALLDDEACQYKAQYDQLSAEIDGIRAEKVSLLDGADLPLEGLSVEAGELTYNGHHWDAMSASEQLRVATAIVRQLNPQCGFVLLDKLEQMDIETLTEFGAWLTEQGLQVIATRVSTGDECSIVIEDGYAKTDETPGSGWKAGEF